MDSKIKFYEVNRGDKLKVVILDDDEGIATKRLGCVGKVVRIHYGGLGSPGVGETRECPYVILKFEDGKTEGFFLTELGRPDDKTAPSYISIRKGWYAEAKARNSHKDNTHATE
jgi:hypothetical protein